MASGDETWIFYSARFGAAPCWYFGKSLPAGGSLSSFCHSTDLQGNAASPEEASWPPEDIVEVRQEGAEKFTSRPPELASQCRECKELQEVVDTLCCSSCASSPDKGALTALSILKAHCSSSVRKKLAVAFAGGDLEAKQILESVSSADVAKDETPLILQQPPCFVEVGAGTTQLVCEAITLIGGKLQYQWLKDGVPLRRAERPRFVLSSAGPEDEGSYVCQVSGGSKTVSTRDCKVCLSASAHEARAAAAAQRARFESPLRRAIEAEKLGNVEDAVTLLGNAIEASQNHEDVLANSLCRRAELQLQLQRFREAFQDAAAAIRLLPSLARAHAARGAAAEKLGLLAEAASSWEAAELLGGIPEAAKRAEECRQRLREFFEAEQEKRSDHDRARGHTSNAEEGWRQSGWQGRYTGGAGAGFFGANNTSGSYAGGAPRVSQTLQRHLQKLGFALDEGGKLPSQDAVRSAYRKLALQAHPDKPGGSKTAFQELQNAYEAVLNAIG
eukprot:TRINITY_DN25960_c0_g1_i2.p1 TRINITY_DN25960_c0_g1~~TRINITY_DN25960_c0_g1_i2.p1  ORF type:complete len:502 (+),score=114.10 TRINITY_DN25960_c0_g1_i2:142-1647(+)